MGALTKIRQTGFDVTFQDGAIEISPFSKLTEIQLAYLKKHKTEIIAELQAEAANDPAKNVDLVTYPCLVDCYTPLGGLIRILAENQERAEWLQRMNPKPSKGAERCP